MHLKWDETAQCYRARAALTCHRRGSMDRANESRATKSTNLTSAALTASSAAQMLGENEDSYVQSYIQTQSTEIACETSLTLPGAVLDHSNWGGQAGATCAFRGHNFKIHLNLKYYSFSHFSPCHVSLRSLKVI